MAAGWTRQNLRHAFSILRYGSNPAATVYDSIGDDFFLALAPGWLNLGMWEGDGSDPSEAPVAVRRLVERLAGDLPTSGDVLDVGNGLAEQDPVIARVAKPRSLTALNITLSQLRAGRHRLEEAGARPVNGDATRLPFTDETFDGVICFEAAFHFRSREAFFAEAFRVLRPGGVLTMSDVPIVRMPRGPRETAAAAAMLRGWGLRMSAVETSEDIERRVAAAGFRDVRDERVGERVIGPALRFVRGRLRSGAEAGASRTYELAARIMVNQAELLWERRIVDYLLMRAVKPEAATS
jgi:SAM-dependent methyltransferase